MTKVFDFSELMTALNSWAEHLPDSPAALAIKDRFKTDVLDRYPSIKWPRSIVQDFTRFMAAVYNGGFTAGRTAGAQAYASTQPKPPQAIRVHGAWETTDEFGRHGAHIGYYSNDVDAKIAAQKRGWYGGEGSVVGYDALRYDGVIYVLRDQIDVADMDKDLPKLRDQKIAAAKAKLTPDELKLLGLKP